MTQPAQAPPPEAVGALATAQGSAQQQISAQTLAMLAALWLVIHDFRDPDQQQGFLTRAVAVMLSAQQATGRVTESYLRQVMRVLGEPLPDSAPVVSLPDSLRRGVPLEDVLARPMATVRYLRTVDVPPDVAAANGLARLRTIAQTNVQLAQRQASQQVLLQLVPKIIGYRRVLRPYLSAGGSCGLCIVAADRVYHVAELLPIHDRCKCITLPILSRGVSSDLLRKLADPDFRLSDEALKKAYEGGRHYSGGDPGFDLNQEDLQTIYGRAGGTAAAKLKRTRYRIVDHGELGPMLVEQGRTVKTADQAAADLKASRAQRDARKQAQVREQRRAELAALESSLTDLEDRAQAGEDVSAPLAWQKARIEQLRKLLGH